MALLCAQITSVATTSLAAAGEPTCCTFFAVGRQGYDNEPTWQIATAMNRIAEQRTVDFALLLGDNFHPRGVTSVTDPQWQQKFELLYSGDSLIKLPFYAVLGNHDHWRNPQAQVDYGLQRLGSGRWRMPATSYWQDFGSWQGAPLARIVFLDSIMLHGRKSYATSNKQVLRSRANQLKLLNQAFGIAPKGRKARWRIIASHYPVRSETTVQSSQNRIMRQLLPELKRLQVDLVLSSNDRMQQVLNIEGEPLHVSTGGGSGRTETRPRESSAKRYINGIPGFSLVTLSSHELKVDMLDALGELQFTAKRGHNH